MITDQQLRKIMPQAGARLTPHLPYISEALELGKINTPERIAAFIAQLAHESGQYLYMEEIADGSAYEWREDLGNNQSGDGPKYKGHGPIQITGRLNHRLCGEFMGLDLINNPTLITRPEYGTKSAAWFWLKAKPALNPCADKGWFYVTTRLINGGDNGWDDRLKFYQRSRAELGLGAYTKEAEVRSIREFQSTHGLAVDGNAGPRTLAALSA
ncbi:MAG: glycoside hydrolase family 19 protein [Pirellulaceae bacterium]